MKKFVCFTLLFCILLFDIFAFTFMEIVSVKDDFGDPTGEKYIFIFIDTFTFSNSATLNSEGDAVGIAIFPDSKSIVCTVLPDSFSGAATFFDDKINIAYKAGDNASKSFRVDSSKYVTFELYGKRYNEILDVIKNNNKIQFVVKGTKYQTDTKYNFTFEYDKDEFNELLSQFE